MILNDLVGQAVPLTILKRGLARGSLGHAYLFSGEEGLGKETVARAVARELLAQGGPLSELHVLEGKDSIGVDEIRTLRQKTAYASDGYCVWIIKDAERMSIPASNAFLKTLEEPRARTYFFLTTTQLQSLLPTIVSRCQHLPFRVISEEDICEWLSQQTGLDSKEARIRSIARLAQGSLGKAWKYWEGSLLESRAEVIEKLIRIPTLNFPEVLGLSLSWPEDREKVALDLQWFLEWFRDILVVKNDISLSLYNSDYEEELHKISVYYSNNVLFTIIREITEMGAALGGNARVRFCLGYLLLLMKKGALT